MLCLLNDLYNKTILLTARISLQPYTSFYTFTGNYTLPLSDYYYKRGFVKQVTEHRQNCYISLVEATL